VAPVLSRRGLLTLAAAAALPAACGRDAESPPAGAPTTIPPVPSVGASVGLGAPRKSGAAAIPPSTSVANRTTPLSGGPVPFRTGQALLGSYLRLKGKSLTESLALRRKQLGREQRIVHAFYNWTDTLPDKRPDIPATSTLLISWAGAHYKEITGGSADRALAANARRLAAHRSPVLLRWGWEMNGNWFSWDGTHNSRKPGGYATAWQRMHRIFADEGAGNVAWVWSPNWNSGPDTAWNRYEHYYPGDAYVDWVGVSAYPFNQESPRTLFHRIVDVYGSRKPIMLAETAAIEHGGRSKADWITSFSAYVRDTPSIGAVVWFDTDVQPGTSENFRIDTSQATLAAYRAMARSVRFSG
jgi:hypothetical protein